METISFEQMPAAMAQMLAKIEQLDSKLTAIEKQQPINESPIDGSELRKRLGISRPTEINMRRRGKLPFLLVNGNYRYNWQEVVKVLSKK